MLAISILSIFPGMFAPVLSIGMIGRAIERESLVVEAIDLRDFSANKHRSVDDTPYGGGSGMVMMAEPIISALKSIQGKHPNTHRILLTPSGTPLNQEKVKRLAACSHITFVCGRYEGVDERVSRYIDEEISIGDYVLTGGELGALVIIDAVTRLQPGVLNNALSTSEESFENGILEYPQYTKPAVIDGMEVPATLLSGNHEQVKRWRRAQSLQRTQLKRPDLFSKLVLSDEDKKL
jgi:tRNA (guanine37-N1)-methyltransferase